MSFSVNPQTLHNGAKDLRALADDTAFAKTYTSSHVNLSAGGTGIFLQMGPLLRNVNDNILDILGRLESVLDQSGNEVDQAADWYASTDSASAAQLDANYPAATPLPEGRGYEDRKGPFVDTVPVGPQDLDYPGDRENGTGVPVVREPVTEEPHGDDWPIDPETGWWEPPELQVPDLDSDDEPTRDREHGTGIGVPASGGYDGSEMCVPGDEQSDSGTDQSNGDRENGTGISVAQPTGDRGNHTGNGGSRGGSDGKW